MDKSKKLGTRVIYQRDKGEDGEPLDAKRLKG